MGVEKHHTNTKQGQIHRERKAIKRKGKLRFEVAKKTPGIMQVTGLLAHTTR